MKRAIAWGLFLFWFAAINVASSLPPSALPPSYEIPHFDKILHFVAFFFGGLFLDNLLRQSRRPLGIPRCLLAFAIVAAFGIVDETRQLLTPGRDGGDYFDMLANVLGAFVGAYFSFFIHGRFPVRNRR